MAMTNKITSLQNPIIKHLTKLRQNRSYRQQQDRVLIAGTKIVKEVLHNTKAYRVLTGAPLDLSELFYEEHHLVTDKILKKISGQEAPEPWIAEVPLPRQELPKTISSLLVLDSLADPGNLGTLIRTALALGWEAVFLLNNTVDPFNDKALRAAKGATFRIPIISGGWPQLKEIIEDHNLELLVADMAGEAAHKISKPALVLSSESHGASSAAQTLGKSVCIPMSGEMESLNVAVAGGILMHIIKPGKND
ncbi:MAG: TrmH family RNA methyltransferase [Chlamydiota bacterium]